MRTVYLHVGRGKTGTTVIQGYLSQWRSELMKQGIHYVYADDRETGAGHQQFAKSFIEHAPAVMIPARNPEQVRRAVFEEISNSEMDLFLMSSENFPLAEVPAIVDFFSALPGETTIKIILFARSQDELAESQYNQLVKLKRETRTFSTFTRDDLNDCDYFVEACKWERVFGRQNVICRIYDAASDVVGHFLGCIPEIDTAALSPACRRYDASANVSIGFKALVAARILNGIEMSRRKEVYAEMFTQLADNDLPALLFDSRQAREFRARFAESNGAFTERFLGRRVEDLGGRRYTDDVRDEIRGKINKLGLG